MISRNRIITCYGGMSGGSFSSVVCILNATAAYDASQGLGSRGVRIQCLPLEQGCAIFSGG